MDQSNKNSDNPQAPPEVFHVVENLFRHEAGKMVAILTHIFGVDNLSLAEDVVQDALARALQTWPGHGVPDNPAAWIMRAARNRALDVVRREKVFHDKEPEIIRLMDNEGASPEAALLTEQEITDDRLRLMFVCSHPLIPAEAQVALALKTLCGFSVTEISRAFLTSEAAIAKRLTRAKQKIREAQIAFEIPAGVELSARLDGVLQSLYLLFNEGYKASGGDRLVREELCHEAIRLTALLAAHPAGNRTRTHALLALMLMNAARLPARVDDEGNLLRLKEQDRTRWDQSLIAQGMFHLAQSTTDRELSKYHLQAVIATYHSTARDYESMEWRQILAVYDRLMEYDDSPVVALNRAVALAEVDGPQAGIQAINQIRNLPSLESYYLLPSVLGELESRLNHWPVAAGHFRRALELAEIKSEQVFLSKRLQECTQNVVPAPSSLSADKKDSHGCPEVPDPFVIAMTEQPTTN